MPLNRFALIVGLALAAAGATVLVAALALPAVQMPGPGLGVAAVLALVAYLLVRAISDRRRSAGDDRHDRAGR